MFGSSAKMLYFCTRNSGELVKSLGIDIEILRFI